MDSIDSPIITSHLLPFLHPPDLLSFSLTNKKHSKCLQQAIQFNIIPKFISKNKIFKHKFNKYNHHIFSKIINYSITNQTITFQYLPFSYHHYSYYPINSSTLFFFSHDILYPNFILPIHMPLYRFIYEFEPYLDNPYSFIYTKENIIYIFVNLILHTTLYFLFFLFTLLFCIIGSAIYFEFTNSYQDEHFCYYDINYIYNNYTL